MLSMIGHTRDALRGMGCAPNKSGGFCLIGERGASRFAGGNHCLPMPNDTRFRTGARE
jgi:hypothetical protein